MWIIYREREKQRETIQEKTCLEEIKEICVSLELPLHIFRELVIPFRSAPVLHHVTGIHGNSNTCHSVVLQSKPSHSEGGKGKKMSKSIDTVSIPQKTEPHAQLFTCLKQLLITVLYWYYMHFTVCSNSYQVSLTNIIHLHSLFSPTNLGSATNTLLFKNIRFEVN